MPDSAENCMIHHSHGHSHAHHHEPPIERAHARNHDAAGGGNTSRRDFLRVLMGGALTGASLLELSYHRAAWARAAAPGADA